MTRIENEERLERLDYFLLENLANISSCILDRVGFWNDQAAGFERDGKEHAAQVARREAADFLDIHNELNRLIA